MTDGDLEILSRFEEVWARVQNQAPKLPSDGKRGLPRLMDGLWALECGYRLVGKGASEPWRRQLCRLAADIERCISRLRLRHFLDSGEIYLTAEQMHFASSPLSNLRNLWKNAGDMTEKLQNASDWEQPVPPRELAAWTQMLCCHRQRLEQMIYELLQ